MNNAELLVMNPDTPMALNSISPEDVGRIAQVRQRQYQVEEVRKSQGTSSTIVRLSGIDVDNLGRSLEVIWEQELDAELRDRELGFARGPWVRPTRSILGVLSHAPLEPRHRVADRPFPGTLPGRYQHRALPARTAADGPLHAAGEPVRGRWRRARQDDRGRADCP